LALSELLLLFSLVFCPAQAVHGFSPFLGDTRVMNGPYLLGFLFLKDFSINLRFV